MLMRNTRHTARDRRSIIYQQNLSNPIQDNLLMVDQRGPGLPIEVQLHLSPPVGIVRIFVIVGIRPDDKSALIPSPFNVRFNCSNHLLLFR